MRAVPTKRGRHRILALSYGLAPEIALKAPPFECARATSLAETCELLARHGDDAKLIAGGQSLVPMMAIRLVRPAFLVDINEIAALKFVAVEQDFARIGACTRQVMLERDDRLAARVPLLSDRFRHACGLRAPKRRH